MITDLKPDPGLVPQDPVHGMRDGEPLELAIADADKKARTFREQANTSLGLAEKWEAVATQLRATRELARSPAAPKSTTLVTDPRANFGPVETRHRKPHGYWLDKLKAVVGDYFAQNGRGPTKSHALKLLAELHPDVSKTAVYQVINRAINEGHLKFRGIEELLYLPEHDPQRERVEASA